MHHPRSRSSSRSGSRRATSNRKALNLHHGISITDEFMEAVREGASFGLRSPKTDAVVKIVDARTLWQKILEIRLQTGEPYLIFSDTVNRAMPQHQRELGMKVRQSNLCSEIMLHTCECGIARFRETSRGHIMGLEAGLMKMIFSLKTRRLLGVHIIGEGATELIHIGQAVLNLGGTLDYFMENAFNYPTLAEAYKIAALDAWNRMPRAAAV
ncbi:MAG: hypothetical protein WDN45_04330 [Caulobacteraceae bacterium]